MPNAAGAPQVRRRRCCLQELHQSETPSNFIRDETLDSEMLKSVRVDRREDYTDA
jgi:hypothetical protein